MNAPHGAPIHHRRTAWISRSTVRRLAALLTRSVCWALLAGIAFVPACDDKGKGSSSGSTPTKGLTPEAFVRREGFRPAPPGSPFIRARWAGEGHVADSLPPAVVGPLPGQTIADIGFGNGRHALAMARRVGPEGRVICRDIDPRAVHALRLKALPNMDVQVSEPGDLHIDPEIVDTALLCDIYHLVQRSQVATRDLFLDSLYRSMKPGGVVVICYIFAGVFNEPEAGKRFIEESDRVLVEHGFETGRRWRFGRAWATPLVFEYRRPLE